MRYSRRRPAVCGPVAGVAGLLDRSLRETSSRRVAGNRPVSRLITVVLTVLAAALLAFRLQPLHWLNARFLPQTMGVIGSACCWWWWASPSPCGRAFISDAIGAARSPSSKITSLIRTGPYGLVRHPIYTGLLLAILGTAVAFRRMARLAGIRIFDRGVLVQAASGGALHERKLPHDYPRYRAEVPALIPFIRGTHRAGDVSL